jgi:opacity protein-like surface antigen
MMRKNFVLLVGAVALIGSATYARAGAYGEAERAEEAPASAPPAKMVMEEQEIDYARLGPYLGVGGNYAIQLFDKAGPGNVSNTGGVHVRAGYRFHPNIAVEVLYEWMSEFDNDSHTPVGPKNTDHFDAWSVSGNLKGYFLTGRWQPYAVIGVGYLDVNGHGVPHSADTSGGADMRFGLGMDGYITEHIAIGPEVAYVLPFGSVENFDMVTVALGLRYRF